MKQRVISAVILIAILVPIIILGKIPFAIAVGLISALAYYEINKIFKFPLPVTILGFISLILIVYSNFDFNNVVLGLNHKMLCISMLLTFIPIVFYQVKGKYNTNDAFILYSFILLVGLGLNYFILIRNMDIKYFLFMLLIPIFTDTFAYLGGILIGKHKATKLSPKKSWEGYITGSLMGTFIMTMYYTTVINNQSNLLIVIGIILLMTIIGQIGDLFFSAIKRNYNVKDFSNLIPGHGGIMDRLDSLVFVSLAFMMFIELL